MDVGKLPKSLRRAKLARVRPFGLANHGTSQWTNPKGLSDLGTSEAKVPLRNSILPTSV